MPAVATWGLAPRTFVGERPPSFGERFLSAVSRIPAKSLARAAGVTPKAAEKWKCGDNAPGADALVKLAAEFDEVWEAVRVSSCRSVDDAEAVLADIKARLDRR